MPNHITNQMTIRGPRESMTRFKDTFFCPSKPETGEEGEALEVDFNGIIPIPSELDNTEAPTSFIATASMELLELDKDVLLKDVAVKEYFASWLERIQEQLSQNQEYLSQMDWNTLTVGQTIELLE